MGLIRTVLILFIYGTTAHAQMAAPALLKHVVVPGTPTIVNSSFPAVTTSVAHPKSYCASANNYRITVPSTTKGNMLVLGVLVNGTTARYSNIWADSNESFTTAGAVANNTTSSQHIALFYVANSNGGATNIYYCATTSGLTIKMWYLEVSGVDYLDVIATPVSNHAGATIVPAPTVTTTSAKSFVVSMVNGAGTITGIHTGNPFTNMTISGGTAVATYAATSTGSYGASWDQSTSSVYASITAAFRSRGELPFSFIQTNYYTTTATTATATATFLRAQTAGNLNIVRVGINDATTNVTSVTDTNLNTYTLAGGSLKRGNGYTVGLYYATNIVGSAANTNTVTVNFSATISSPDIIINEYKAHPSTVLDAASVATATGTADPITVTVSTTYSPSLIIYADCIGGGHQPSSNLPYQVHGFSSHNNNQIMDLLTTGGSSTASSVQGSGSWVTVGAAFH